MDLKLAGTRPKRATRDRSPAMPPMMSSRSSSSGVTAALSNRRNVVKKKIEIREKEGQTARAMARAEKARAKVRAERAELQRARELEAAVTIQASTRRSLVLLQHRKANGTYVPPVRKVRTSGLANGDKQPGDDGGDSDTEYEKARMLRRPYQPRNQPRSLEFKNLVEYPLGARSPRPAELESKVVEGRAQRATERVVPCAPVTRAFAQVLQRQQSQTLLAYQEAFAIEMSRDAWSKYTEENHQQAELPVLAWGQEGSGHYPRSPGRRSPDATGSRPRSPDATSCARSPPTSFRATGSEASSTPSRRRPSLPAPTTTSASASAASKMMDAPSFKAAAESFKKLDVAPLPSFRKNTPDVPTTTPSATEVLKVPLETIPSARLLGRHTPEHVDVLLQRVENNSFGLATVGDRELVMTVMAKAEAQRVEAELHASRPRLAMAARRAQEGAEKLSVP